MDAKRCFKCGLLKPTRDFYRHPQMGDGLLGKCKACTKNDAAAHYRATWPKRVEYEKRRFLEADRAQDRIVNQRNQRARHPLRYKARQAVSYAVRAGRLIKQPCVRCGATKNVQAHHHDYSKPLDVEWLCRPCHLNEHGKWSFERFAATGRPLLIDDRGDK